MSIHPFQSLIDYNHHMDNLMDHSQNYYLFHCPSYSIIGFNHSESVVSTTEICQGKVT